jgi:hypothetical protein
VIVRGANWLALKSYGGGQSWNNQKGDKNKLKLAPQLFKRGYKYKEEREGDPSSSQNLSTAAVCFSSLPPSQRKLNQASNKCLFECVRESVTPSNYNVMKSQTFLY